VAVNMDDDDVKWGDPEKEGIMRIFLGFFFFFFLRLLLVSDETTKQQKSHRRTCEY